MTAATDTTGGPVSPAQVAAVASLAVLPLLVYGLPALLGHPVVPGDDTTQNLPLRELVGHDLRAGELPVFDPYIWSGAPLLGGWNAGAAYPLTWLFAVLPGDAAWTLNLVAAGAAAGLGCYAFLRASRLAVLASWMGATTFAFGGGMVAQIPHVGLVIGMSWVPLALLAILRLTARGAVPARSRLRWTAVLAVAVGLVFLAGEPRAVTDGIAVLLLYGAWRVSRLVGVSWRPAAARAGSAVVGLGLGAGLGAVQLVPGLAAVATSQRAHVTAYLFGAGSFPLRWLPLFGVPDLLGGSGSFGQPVYFANYNLTELTGYVGLLPLVGAFALFGRLRARRPVGEWLVWEVVAAAGVLLALGDNTPLGQLLIHVPLLGGQRLQSRAVVVTDLALAILLAYWFDGWSRRPARRGAPTDSSLHASRAERVLGALPLLVIAGILAAAFAAGASLLEWMGVPGEASAHALAIRPWLVLSTVLVFCALALVLAGPRLAPRGRGVLAAAFLMVDLIAFTVTTVVAVGVPNGPASPRPTASSPSRARAPSSPPPPSSPGLPTAALRPLTTLHLSGRFAVYDPGLLDESQLAVLGVPDANVMAGTWSLQGYGSIVDAGYAAATGVHGVSGQGQDVFSPRAAVDGVFDALSTQVVLTPSDYLRIPLRRGAAGTASPGSRPGARRLAPADRSTWYLGAPLAVRAAAVDVRSAPGSPGPATPAVKIGLVTEAGGIDWARSDALHAGMEGAQRGTVRWGAAWPSPPDAVALVVEAESTVLVSLPTVTEDDGHAYVLDGTMQRAMVAPRWAYEGQDGAFAVFVDRAARPPLSLLPLRGGSLHGASVRRVSGPPLQPDAAVVTSRHGVDVVRAVAAAPGWTAWWQPSSGAGRHAGMPRRLALHRRGVVEVVRVPAGRGIVSWRYVAPGLLVGGIASAVAVLLVIVLLLAAAACGRRSRNRPGLGRHSPPPDNMTVGEGRVLRVRAASRLGGAHDPAVAKVGSR